MVRLLRAQISKMGASAGRRATSGRAAYCESKSVPAGVFRNEIGFFPRVTNLNRGQQRSNGRFRKQPADLTMHVHELH